MKAANSKTASQQLAGEIQLARLRLTKAENQLKSAKVQSRLARRRRKEAKQAARRAKKQAKLAKQEFAEAKLALAEAEAKLVRSQKRTTKTRKPSSSMAPVATRKRKLAQPDASGPPKPGKPKSPGPTPPKRAPNTKKRVRKADQPIEVARHFEMPTATASVPVGDVKLQTEARTGELQTGGTATGGLVEPTASDGQTL